MPIAITRAVSPNLGNCELAYFPRRPIDVALARDQHSRYESCLRESGAELISLPAEPGLPDSVFVEDPALVLNEIAIIARMGAPSRRPESELLATALSSMRPLHFIQAPGTLEGGDVIRIGRTLLAGHSNRTNAEGIRQLAALCEPLGYTVRAVRVQGCLHLKSAACWLGDDAILVNRAWLDTGPLEPFRLIDIAPHEPWAANVLPVGGSLIASAAFPATCSMLEKVGYRVVPIEMSELAKAEGAITCCSQIFER